MSVIRKSFLIQARPGMAQEYVRRHQQVWPELLETLKSHGVSNYSIFLHEPTGQLLGYLEIEDEARFQRIGETEVCRKWWRWMTEVLVCDAADAPKAHEDILREVFHLQ
jgi:L-rhamnose mutarotase